MDDAKKNIIKELYTDPETDEHVFRTMMTDNTTFLIGRKGTGKSTIFARCQQEIRETKNKISIYVDVKTLFGTSQAEFVPMNGLGQNIDKEIVERYLLHREFLRNILKEIKKEFKERIKSSIIQRITDSVLSARLDAMAAQLLEEIDEPHFDDMTLVKSVARTESGTRQAALDAKAAVSAEPLSVSTEYSSQSTYTEQFAKIFLRYFNIKKFLEDTQIILNAVGIEHLFIFFDDFSELDKNAMEIFVEVILAPLNNWSNEFIKLKVAAYPGRIYFGEIDPGKIDQIHLDFFALYGIADKILMEERAEEKARDYTRRILEKRIKFFSQGTVVIEKYFEPTNSMDYYYDLLFKMSMNVPRIMGYILHYAYPGTIARDKPISKSVLESAAERYYAEIMEPAIELRKFAQEAFEEKIDSYQQFELLRQLVEKAKDAKTHITTSSAPVFFELRAPPTSHFYVRKALEEYLLTLELNFFVHKYREMADRDGVKSSVYAINYGLCMHENIYWGRPAEGTKFRKYFIERVFDRNSLVKEHVESAKIIRCMECYSIFPLTDLEKISTYNMLCPKCMKGKCRVDFYGEKFKHLLETPPKEDLLPKTDLEILQILQRAQRENLDLYATPISEELDTSVQLIGARAKILENKALLRREYKELDEVGEHRCYYITTKASEKYFAGKV